MTIIRGLTGLAWLLPRRICIRVGDWIGRLAFQLMGSRAQVAMENLALVYGEQMTPVQRRALACRNYGHIGGVLLECLYLVARPKMLFRFLTLEGREHLQAVLAKGRGVVIFSGHLGNFPLMTSALMTTGNARILFRDPTDPRVSAMYRWMRERVGIQTIADNPRSLCAYKSMKHLRNRGILVVLIDQVETGGVYVDFMGHPAGSTTGAAKLALLSGAALIPAFCVREPDRRLKVTIGPEFQLPPGSKSADDEAYVTQLVAGMNQVVEKAVRAFPEQWLWAHRRWRKWRK